MEENVIQINVGIMINVNASVKNSMYVQNIMFGVQLLVIMKMENIQQVLWMTQRLHVIKLPRIIGKLFDETKTILTNFDEKQKYFLLPDHQLVENLILVFGFYESTKKG